MRQKENSLILRSAQRVLKERGPLTEKAARDIRAAFFVG